MGSGFSQREHSMESDNKINNNAFLPEKDHPVFQSHDQPTAKASCHLADNLHQRHAGKRTWRKTALNLPHKCKLSDTVDEFKLQSVRDNVAQFRMGRNTVTIDTRAEQANETCVKPNVPPGELWEDPDFSEDIAFRGLKDKVFYKRPKVSEWTYGVYWPQVSQNKLQTVKSSRKTNSM
jgi:hypothetical protein